MSLQLTVEQLIRIHDLKPHPEGGYFRETYRSGERIAHGCLPARFGGDRCYSTAIYYLLPSGSVSRLHRIASDEVWHFYLGGPLTIFELPHDEPAIQVVLGSDVERGQRLQHVVRAGAWFGAYPSAGSDYCFVGCTVAPGFDFPDLEIANRHDLLDKYPKAKDVIEKLTEE
jgi:uncharacterized protein